MNKEPSQVKKSKDEILMQVCNITDKEEWSYVEHITPIQALKAMEEYRSQSELPSDGITKFTEKEIDAAKSVRDSFLNQAGVERYKQVYMAGEIVMSDQLQPILASHVARIKELEEALKISEEIVSELNRGYNRFM